MELDLCSDPSSGPRVGVEGGWGPRAWDPAWGPLAGR